MSENMRLGLALLLGFGWCVWVAIIWWRKRPKYTASANHIVAYASQTGQARLKAQAFFESLTDAVLLPLNHLTLTQLKAASQVDLFVSTYGDGEPPDNGRAFLRPLSHIAADSLTSLKYSVTAFGDSHYPEFCAFGKQVFTELNKRGANALKPLVCIDASQPQTQDKNFISDFTDVKLLESQQLNPGSPFAGLYLLRLSAADLNWQAGDILEVIPSRLVAGVEPPSPRSYSIASADSRFVENNEIKLIVRLLTKDDGQFGLASGFLTQSCQVGDTIKVKVRANPACQLKTEQSPLLLIGAGSGLAGLIGHIEQRCYFDAAGPVWLIYGERDPEFDCTMQAELDMWQQQGILTRVDRVFSRAKLPYSKATPTYVHDVLTKHADEVCQFIGKGADVYVCGSLEGMGKSVDRALTQILGEDGKNDLLVSERYHRDLY